MVWTRKDLFFPLEDGRRLAADLDATLEVLDDTRTFIPHVSLNELIQTGTRVIVGS